MAEELATTAPADRLTGQLYHLPAIVGRLGISIATAQKALNVEYLDSLQRLLRLVKDTVGHASVPVDPNSKNDKPEDALAAGVLALVRELAPSRYQFTETTIDFSADLAETLSKTVAGGIGAGFGAIVVNAAFSRGFRYDYRAAARITSVLHAIPASAELRTALLSRAKEIRDDKLGLPGVKEIDATMTNQVGSIINALFAAAKVPEKKATEGVAAGGGGGGGQ